MKKLLLSLAFALFSLSAFAATLDDFSLSVEPLFGMKYGQIDEYVFLKKSNFTDDKLSELNWEIKPELYYGLRINGGWNKFFTQVETKFGIPMKTGSMFDSDWFNAQTNAVTAAKAAGHDYKTCYSQHDNYLDYDIQFSIKGGYSIQILDWFTIKPAAAFEYENIKFTGRDGKGLYGFGKDGDFYTKNGYYAAYNDTKNRGLMNFSGRVITYNRVSDYFWLGSDFSVKLPKNFEINTGFFVAPYVYAISYDSHLTSNVDYADKTIDIFGAFKWNLGASYKINERHSVSLNATYLYMRVISGDNYDDSVKKNTYVKSSKVDGGAGAKWFDLSLSYRFKIF